MQRISLFLLGLLLHLAAAQADVLVLKEGQVLIGSVQAQGEESYRFQRGTTNVVYSSNKVSLVSRKQPQAEADAEPGLPSWGSVLERVGAQTWGSSLTQIPATVIDEGVFRNVPYLSFRCGVDYEVNVYGDPEHPSGVEIGCYRSLLTSAEAKENCISLIAGLLKRDDLMVAVKYANRSKDMLAVKEWLVEVTPPDEPDAYGGWWISVYAVKTLDAQRASAQELAAISVARSEITDAGEANSGWTKQDLRSARPALPPIAPRPAITPRVLAPVQTPVARVTPPAAPPRPIVYQAAPVTSRAPVAYTAPSGGGRVYVRAYTRKDGTYVHSHSRKR